MLRARLAIASIALALGCHQRFNVEDLNLDKAPPPDPIGVSELRLVTPVVAQLDDGTRRATTAFPLKHTAITAEVGGMMAEYHVEQEFENPFDEAIEAVYSFPLGHTGAVNGFEMKIGTRTITGEIKKRAQAKQEYREAKQQGHTAALVEQDKPNVFTQHIANIAPKETVRVRLRYVDLLPYRDGAYELVVPLVVGPRYLPADDASRRPVSSHHAGDGGRPGTTAIPYVDATRGSSTVSFTANIDAGVPMYGVTSNSHAIRVETISPTRSRVTLANDGEIPNRDLRIRYATAGANTTAAILTHRTGHTGYFVLAIQPKANYQTTDIAGREVMVVVDTSGSMSGRPLDQAKHVSRGIVSSLTERDTFNILTFASGVEAMSTKMKRGDDAGKQDGYRFIDGMNASGGTEMQMGVVEMLAKKPGDDRVRMIYFLTDGFVGNDDVVVGAAHELLGSNRIFTIGVGEAPNRSLLDNLADVGRGFSTYISLREDPAKVTRDLLRRSAKPYLTDITVDWKELGIRQQDPAIIPDLYAGMPLILSGIYETPKRGTIYIRGNTGGQQITIPVAVDLPEKNVLPPIGSLWARRRIEQLSRPSDIPATVVEDRITQIGLLFGLMTEYTSFIAVDRSRVVVPGGATKIVEQPAIVPDGVDPNAAVGSHGGETFKPTGTWRDTAQRDRSYRSSRGGGGGGGGGLFGSGASPDTPIATYLLVALLAMLGAAWLVIRRRAARPARQRAS